ncbi:hypothetical protein CYQ82_08470 [Enterococcus faecium]|nr:MULTISPECIES: hypothetical protein [Enterococcus]EOF77704.1 hypothetical protein SGC_01919 [Enterococcus faecium EnGen0136]ROX77822.1 hypothetical protein EGW38_11455 [Enterococcus faecium]RXW42237.1 hypothetical protein CYQ82_08470 [Enterococcus faecium]RXW42758.1 hypothetical protein CYQ83_08525 [Enterococcus faecium]RXW76690.1 hypothetical protein CYQ67_08580 [Enterococcus faecium]
MEEYGKILKKKDGLYTLELYSFNKFCNYGTIMKEQYDLGFTQVIVNTELMLNIAENMLINNWTLIKVEIDDPSVDKDTEEEISNLVELIKSNVLNFNKLKSFLEWALDDGSIFIDKLKLGISLDEKIVFCEINSNGLIYGNDNELVFSMFIKEPIEEYLNGPKL